MKLKPELGQYFTPPQIVEEMVHLIQNNGAILEPSCGDGAFFVLPAKQYRGAGNRRRSCRNLGNNNGFF